MNKIVLLLMVTLLFSFACKQNDNGQEQPQTAQETAPDTDNGADINTEKPERDSKVIARVNGVPIYEDELKNTTVDNLVTEEILYQQGLKQGLLKKYQDRIMDFQKQIIVNDVKSNIVNNMPPQEPVYEEEVRKYYDAHKEIYSSYEIKEINFKDKSQGEEIAKMAEEGVTLEDIASKLGDDVTVEDLGYNKTMSRRFGTKEVGSITEVLEKKDGTYSILEIVAVKTLPYEYVEKPIRSNLEAIGRVKAVNAEAQKIAEENNMKIEILDNQ